MSKNRMSTEHPPLAYRIEEASRVSGLSRTTLYKLIASKELASAKVAGRRLVPADALKKLIAGHADAVPDAITQVAA